MRSSTSSLSESRSTERAAVRVAFCLDNLGVGGTELNAVRLAETLDRSRYEVIVACFSDAGPLADRLRRAGVRIQRYPVGSVASPNGLRQALRFARFLRQERVALVHAHDRYSNAFSVVAARLAGVPVVASKRWAEALVRHRLTNYLGFRMADVVLANSPSVAHSLEHDDGVERARIAVVPNFLDDQAFEPMATTLAATLREELAIPETARVVGIVASLRPVKDHDTLLRATAIVARRLPEVVLVLVGDGESRGKLETLAHDLGIADSVRFAGVRPHSPSMHWLFDVSVLCSRNEGFPNTILEAMAAAKPVVATDVPGIRDAVRPGETGMLVPPADPLAMADALERLLSDDRLAKGLGTRGREWARQDFNAAKVRGELTALYDRLLERAR